VLRYPALRAERDALAALAAERDRSRGLDDRRTLHPLPDEPPAAEPDSLAAANRALVAQLRGVEEHNARMVAVISALASDVDGWRQCVERYGDGLPAMDALLPALGVTYGDYDDQTAGDTAAALRAPAGGAP
jgi:hypothetical protein